MPEPPAMQMMGVFSGSEGRLKAGWDGRTETCSESLSRREARYDVATPMWAPCPERASSLRMEKVRVTWSGFQRGEDEMELDRTG